MEQGASIAPAKFTIPYRSIEQIDADMQFGAVEDAGPALKADTKDHLGKVAAPPRDNVNLPQHYTRYKIEPIRFSIENELDGFQFNIVKYTLRHKFKNKREDLNKARRYLEMYIKYEYDKDPEWWR